MSVVIYVVWVRVDGDICCVYCYGVRAILVLAIVAMYVIIRLRTLIVYQLSVDQSGDNRMKTVCVRLTLGRPIPHHRNFVVCKVLR